MAGLPTRPTATIASGEFSEREQTRPRWFRWGRSSAYHKRGPRNIVAEQGRALEKLSAVRASRGPQPRRARTRDPSAFILVRANWYGRIQRTWTVAGRRAYP